MHLRIFTAEANTGIGTHGRCVAEALKRVAPEKICCEVISTNDQQAISLAIEKSEPSDVAIFFMPHHLQEELVVPEKSNFNSPAPALPPAVL